MSVNELSIVDRFCEVYGNLNATNVDLIEQIYDDNIVFMDPLHRIDGLDSLKQYMANMYANLSDYSIEINESFQQQDIAYIHWDIAFKHPKLRHGELIQFSGVTRLEVNGKIVSHQDFFDAGAMLYEHIPVLGKITRWIKARAGQ